MGEILKQMEGGVLIVDKPQNMTSHDVVNKVRRLFNTKQVGHTGTLDPMATGVLAVLVGRAVKACEYVSHDEKKYDATLRFGITTDTQDTTGTVLSQRENLPTEEQIREILPQFTGNIMQLPPMYSSLKVNGQKLVDLARKGITVEREARPITIFELTLKGYNAPDAEISVHCSGGTYIRTLCEDMGNALDCGGCMATLRRTEAGGFTLDQAHTLEDLEKLTEEERWGLLLPTDTLFSTLPRVVLSDFFQRLFLCGSEIYQKKIGTTYPMGERLKVYDKDGNFLALGEIREYPDGTAIKMIKQFRL